MRISGAVVDGFTNGLREIGELREGYLHREDGKVRLQGGGTVWVQRPRVGGARSSPTVDEKGWNLLEIKESEKSFKKFNYGLS